MTRLLTDAKRMSVDTLWYNMLSLMQQLNIHVQRESFKARLKKICDMCGVRRDQLNLITGARAELYFNGSWESVSFDAIDELAAKGTDIIVIEKEGIPDELREFADKYGIAMVNSRGYLTEFAHDLMIAARNSGANIIVITDYDLTGINLASKCKGVLWITMDDDTLDYFKLNKFGTSDGYNKELVVNATNKKLIRRVTELMEKDSRFSDLDIEFLKFKRIEINAVLAKVGAEKFWKFIMFTLKKYYPKRNYNRAIERPSKDPDMDETDLYPPAVRSLILHVRDIRDGAVETTEKQIVVDQQNIEGFLEVAEQRKKNKDLVRQVVADNEDIKKIELEVAKLCRNNGIDILED
jgi:hypothetical protein